MKAISFSVSDAEAAPGQSTGAGQLRVAFLNSHSGPVQIHPAVLFVSRQGVLTEMPLDTMVVAAGESSEQTATFRIPISTLMDPGGYIALLTWSVSEGSTATVTRSSGPVPPPASGRESRPCSPACGTAAPKGASFWPPLPAWRIGKPC